MKLAVLAALTLIIGLGNAADAGCVLRGHPLHLLRREADDCPANH